METCLQELKPFSQMKEDEFLSDRKNPPFMESYLRRGLEAVFVMGRHILAKTYGFKEIEYKTIAKVLGERGVITKELADVLYVMAGYRNRMVHFYREISPQERYQIAVNNLKDFDTFVSEIVAFVRAYEKKGRDSLNSSKL
jgi:uncharacterized protein YutE (UPF0331/DUF86 family)